MVDADMPLDDFGALTAIEINQESNSYTMGAVTFHLAADWNEHWFYNDKDGYFYCKSVIAIGKKTPPLLDYVTISSDTKQKLKSLGTEITWCKADGRCTGRRNTVGGKSGKYHVD